MGTNGRMGGKLFSKVGCLMVHCVAPSTWRPPGGPVTAGLQSLQHSTNYSGLYSYSICKSRKVYCS